jgi:hypothetical protein
VWVIKLEFQSYFSTVTNKDEIFDPSGTVKRGFLRDGEQIKIFCKGVNRFSDKKEVLELSIVNNNNNNTISILALETDVGSGEYYGYFSVNATSTDDALDTIKIENEDLLNVQAIKTYPQDDATNIKDLTAFQIKDSVEIDIAEIAALDAAFTKRRDKSSSNPVGICNQYLSPSSGHRLRGDFIDAHKFLSPIANPAQEVNPFLLEGDPASDLNDYYMALRTKNDFYNEQDAVECTVDGSGFQCPPTDIPNYSNYVPHDCSTTDQQYWQDWIQNTAGKADILYLTAHGSPGGFSGKTDIDQQFNIDSTTYSCGDGNIRCFNFTSDEASTDTNKVLFNPFNNFDNDLDLEWIILHACDVFESDTSLEEEIAIEWANLLLDSPSDSSVEYKNPIHGIIGNRGTAPLDIYSTVYTVENFEYNLRVEGKSIMLAWAQACIDVSFIDIDGTDVNSSLNAAFIVRDSNKDDALPPHGTMTADTDSNNIDNFYIDYTAKVTADGDYTIVDPEPNVDFEFLDFELGMKKVTLDSIGL